MKNLCIAMLVAHYTGFHPLSMTWLIVNWVVALAEGCEENMFRRKYLEALQAIR